MTTPALPLPGQSLEQPTPVDTPAMFGVGNIIAQQRATKLYPSITTDAELMAMFGYLPEPIHILLYGHSGSGKSLCARTMPTPWLVVGWDSYDNMRSYTKGLVTQQAVYSWGTAYQLEYTDCWTPEGHFVGRIEHYAEPTPEYPKAYATFMARAAYLSLPHIQMSYGFTPRTVIWDSMTFATYAAVLYHMMMNGSTSAFKMSGHAKTSMVKDILSRLAWMRCNVVVVAHLARPDDKEEYNTGLVRGASAVGTLGSELPTGFGEVYRSFIIDRPGQEQEFWLQTKGDSLYTGKSITGVPNPCQPHYMALWEK